MKTWYKNWFDSPFYHILYRDRDEEEAGRFLDNLIGLLKPVPGSRILDQACGRGRHARHLNNLGFDVCGIDLSAKSIGFCKHFENDRLHFYIQDMRKAFYIRYFDYVLNLFTSLGYFETDHQQELVITAAAQSLKPGGNYVIDFMNVEKVLDELIAETTMEKEGIVFRITKRPDKGFLLKTISFEQNGHPYEFQERVEMLYPEDFFRFFKRAGLVTLHTFGNYLLEEFNGPHSDRLILIAGKQ